MSIFNRMALIQSLIPNRRAAADRAQRWQAARLRTPELAADLIGFADLLAIQPATYQCGMPVAQTLDPLRLAYEAGRRDLALQLLALMGLTTFELNSMMEDFDHEEHQPRPRPARLEP